MPITIPERDLGDGDETTVLDDSPLTLDAQSPGTVSTGARLYSNPKPREPEQQKFGIKLQKVEP